MFFIRLLRENKYNSCICSNRGLSSSLSSIYALASGLNKRCGVAVIRLSGQKCLDVINKLTNLNSQKLEPRKMYLRDFYDPVTKEKIDKGLLVWFKEPNSFTGEDVCEFHLHGGNAILRSFFSALSTFKDLRQAEPGEFSKRALLNGKMDLTEVEGLNDLINAETEMQRKQALDQMEGSLSKLYNKWRDDIIKCLANVEAFIDFHEEENIEDDVLDHVDTRLRTLKQAIEMHLNDNRKGERLRDGVRVVIVGEPNAGKSSLLNNICQRPAAIVSPIPGTTRDVIESTLNIAGYPIVLSDTAGLRETSDVIEMEGVKRALERVNTADIIILVIDLKKYFGQVNREFIENHLKQLLNNAASSLGGKIVICAFNKIDLVDAEMLKLNENVGENIFLCKMSCINETNGIDELLNTLKIQVSDICSNQVNDLPTLTRQRHRDNLVKCLECIDGYLVKSKSDSEYKDIVLLAEELRNATKWLGMITGTITSEHVFDVIFRDFCIGK